MRQGVSEQAAADSGAENPAVEIEASISTSVTASVLQMIGTLVSPASWAALNRRSPTVMTCFPRLSSQRVRMGCSMPRCLMLSARRARSPSSHSVRGLLRSGRRSSIGSWPAPFNRVRWSSGPGVGVLALDAVPHGQDERPAGAPLPAGPRSDLGRGLRAGRLRPVPGPRRRHLRGRASGEWTIPWNLRPLPYPSAGYGRPRQHPARHGLVERPTLHLGARRAADHQKVRPAPSQHDPDLPATLAPQRHPAHVAALGPNCHRRSLYPAEVVAFNGDRARRIISKEVALGCSPE